MDFLALELRDNGWSLRRLVRQVVLSSTYRQSSAVSEELKRRDPDNELFARQLRMRLDAEFVLLTGTLRALLKDLNKILA